MNDARYIGLVPTQSVFVRFASTDDWRADIKRIALFQAPDGQQHWICNGELKPFIVQIEVEQE